MNTPPTTKVDIDLALLRSTFSLLMRQLDNCRHEDQHWDRAIALTRYLADTLLDLEVILNDLDNVDRLIQDVTFRDDDPLHSVQSNR